MLRPVNISNGKGETYLRRWNLINTKNFTIKLHHFLLSDEDCMHDHPWDFVSIILKGYYYETTPTRCKVFKAGSILFRRASHIHRILIDKSAWSLVFTFKYKRHWGFHTPTGWIPWRKYLALRKNPCN